MAGLRSLMVAVIAGVATSSCNLLLAESVDETSARESIASATRRFVTAFNNGDIATMESLWTRRGDFVADNGKRVFFQDRLMAASAAARTGGASPDPSSLVMSINTIRFVTSDVATVDGSSIYRSSSHAEPTHARYTAVWVLRDNNWKIDSIRENQLPDNQHNAHLKELAWLVGNWTDSLDNPRLQTRIHWSTDGNYLDREFKSELPGWGEQTGTERIGWDAQSGQFRSWIFKHDGGFSQGIWTASENGWTIEYSGVTAEGRPTGCQITIASRNEKSLEMTSVDGTIDGQPTPDFRLRLMKADSP